MAIAATPIFEAKARQFMALESELFNTDFIMAVNNTLDRYAVVMDLATKPAYLTSVEENIDIDSRRQYVIEAGVDFYVLGYGNFKAGDRTVASAEDAFERALTIAQTDRDLTDQRAGPSATSIGVTNTDTTY